jgi:hypothetical protein
VTRHTHYQPQGATYYAVPAGLVRLVQAIMRHEHTLLSVSNLVRGSDPHGRLQRPRSMSFVTEAEIPAHRHRKVLHRVVRERYAVKQS